MLIEHRSPSEGINLHQSNAPATRSADAFHGTNALYGRIVATCPSKSRSTKCTKKIRRSTVTHMETWTRCKTLQAELPAVYKLKGFKGFTKTVQALLVHVPSSSVQMHPGGAQLVATSKRKHDCCGCRPWAR